jgi:hypothetical protein
MSKVGRRAALNDKEWLEVMKVIDAMTSLSATWPQIEDHLVRQIARDKIGINSIPTRQQVDRYLKKYYKSNFGQYREKMITHLAMSVKQKIMSLGLQQNNLGALVILMRNCTDWVDRYSDTNVTINNSLSNDLKKKSDSQIIDMAQDAIKVIQADTTKKK